MRAFRIKDGIKTEASQVATGLFERICYLLIKTFYENCFKKGEKNVKQSPSKVALG